MYDHLRDECMQLAQTAQFESLLTMAEAITLDADLCDHFDAAAIGAIGMSEACFGLGAFHKAARYARRGVYFAEQGDLPWALADALNQLSVMTRLIDGDVLSACTRARQALPLADSHGAIEALIGIGAATAQHGAYEQALSALDTALTRVMQIDAPALEARVFHVLAQITLKIGLFPLAFEQYRLALESARMACDPANEALITCNLAWAYFQDKRTRPDSLETLCDGLTLARSIGYVYAEYRGYLVLGRIYQRLREASLALAAFEAAYDRAESVYLRRPILDGLIAVHHALKHPEIAAAYQVERGDACSWLARWQHGSSSVMNDSNAVE